ncbi:pantetheine-phosphate adenylyltransferase [Marinilactibacillus kalidii]|uniref:pantetheine-phosphate adenylyltransferase n=1 Tax=Marinilactibacillus kalidii TaxID=2820274 RepID=UPI001ABE2E3D|nr:pantetheine-phosphate adenylyltransferase [Marinilactibacillus kalidii]
MKVAALYAGSFDPFTNGHLDIVSRAATLFDEVIIAVSENISKKAMFSAEDRMKMIETSLKDSNLSGRVRVVKHAGGLTIDMAEELSVKAMVRGLRSIKDMEYEMDIASMNHFQNSQIETVFLMSSEKYRFVSSSLIKEVAKFNGDIQGLVPDNIKKEMTDRLGQEESR